MMQKFQEFLKQKKWQQLKKSDWAALALAGVLLLIIAMPSGNGTGEKKTAAKAAETVEQNSTKTDGADAADDYVLYLEKKLEEVLSQMEGVGKTKVMITVSDSGESVVEKDRTDASSTTSESDSSGGSRTATERQYSVSTVYVENGETYPYVGKELLPTIEGVVVVAEGGGNSKVVSDIFEAVQALFPVEAHRIKVLKMTASD